ncbi:MAG: hypothetical protein AAF639_05900 [Chloroflexota bacterium]
MIKTKIPILKEDKSYSFSDYFNLNFPTEAILAEFGYELKIQPLNLPQGEIESWEPLQQAMIHRLPYVSLNTEAARREFYVSPILWGLLDHFKFRLEIEYPINAGNKLKGAVDYFIRSTQQNLMIIEAKNADMERGFTQLAVEMLAFNEYLADVPEPIYGAVTTGDLWRFGMLVPSESRVYKDVTSFLLPQNLDPLVKIFAGIVS